MFGGVKSLKARREDHVAIKWRF